MQENTINPGEAVLAVVTLWPFIQKQPVKFRVTENEQVLGLNRTVSKLAKSLVNGGDTTELPECDVPYAKLLDRFAAGIDQSELEQASTAIRDAEAGMEMSRVLENAWNFLTEAAPRVLFENSVATVNLEVDRSSAWFWSDHVGLVADPLRVFAKIADGSLLPSDVTVLEHCYPTLLDAIRLAVDNAIADGLANKKSFELPAYTEFGVAVLRGKPIKASLWQDSYIVANGARSAQPSPSQAAKSPLAAEAASNVEQSLCRPPGTK